MTSAVVGIHSKVSSLGLNVSDLISKNEYWWDLSKQDIHGEEWRKIGESDFLFVSNMGRIKSVDHCIKGRGRNQDTVLRRGRIISQKIDSIDRCFLVTKINAKRATFRVHILVAMAFIENKNNDRYVLHEDDNPRNNTCNNLSWGSQSKNIKDAYFRGRKVAPKSNLGNIGVLSAASVKVSQFDLNGVLVKEWDCISDIQRDLGYNRPNICKCCKGKINLAYGYIWKYKTNEHGSGESTDVAASGR